MASVDRGKRAAKARNVFEDSVQTVVDASPRFFSAPLYSFYEGLLRRELAGAKRPQHIAVLADGNRRWARANAPGKPLEVGYKAGADKLKQFVGWCHEASIEVVTLWVLSTDNLNRSQDDELLPLLDVIADLVDELSADDANRVAIVGDLSLLPDATAERLAKAQQRSQASDGQDRMRVNVAVAYGGRHELMTAMQSLLKSKAADGLTLDEVANELAVEQIAEHLYTKGQPDPDLIIRTSGEQRLSGFLMWQSAHSEFYFCEALWPDFRLVDFYRALRSYSERERRFGK